jgi:hypothetical protein
LGCVENGEYQNEAGQARCERVSKANMYIQEELNDKGELVYSPVVCPPLGLIPEARCENGKISYKQGYWHDGLDGNPATEGLYEHRSVVVQGSCYTQPVAAAKGDNMTVPAVCTCTNGKAGTQEVLAMCRQDTVYSPDADTRFYTCPCRDCCNVDEASGSVTCEHGTAGLLCTKCRSDYYKSADEKCYPCTDADRNMTGVIIVMILLLMAVFILRMPSVKAAIDDLQCVRLAVEVSSRLGLMTMTKIIFSFYQVVLLIRDIYGKL